MSTSRDLVPTPDPLLTIAIVVRNDPTGLAATLDSLAMGWQPKTECLVVDGSDDPPQVEAIAAAHPSLQARIHWSAPRGVYAAMNEALTQASGEYVWFINAGDCAHSPLSLVTVLRIAKTRPIWAYGQVRFMYERGGGVLPPPFNYKVEKRANFSRGRFPPHQGTMAATQVLRELGGFDEEFDVVADYALMLRLSQLADPVESREVWADFYEGGLSTSQWKHAIREFHRARMAILQPSGSALVKERVAVLREFLMQSAGRTLKSLRR